MENSPEIPGLPIRKGHHCTPAIKVSWDFCTVKLYTLCYSLCFTRYSSNLNRMTWIRIYFHNFQIKVLNDNIYIKVPFIKQSVLIYLRCVRVCYNHIYVNSKLKIMEYLYHSLWEIIHAMQFQVEIFIYGFCRTSSEIWWDYSRDEVNNRDQTTTSVHYSDTAEMTAMGASDPVFKVVLWIFQLWSGMWHGGLLCDIKIWLLLHSLETQKMALLLSCYLDFVLFWILSHRTDSFIWLPLIVCSNYIHNFVEYVYTYIK